MVKKEKTDVGVAASLEAMMELQGGIASIKVSDGEVFMFTSAVLEQLLEMSRASGSGKAVVFVKNPMEA